jgi:hypothetical protein
MRRRGPAAVETEIAHRNGIATNLVFTWRRRPRLARFGRKRPSIDSPAAMPAPEAQRWTQGRYVPTGLRNIYSWLSVTIRRPERHAPTFVRRQKERSMNEFAKIDHALDAVLIQLGGVILGLSSPEFAKSVEERHALARSVSQYSVCAASSDDPRVQLLRIELEAALKPRLRLAASR